MGDDYSGARSVFAAVGWVCVGVMVAAATGLAILLSLAALSGADDPRKWVAVGGLAGLAVAAALVWLQAMIGRAICDIAAATARIAEITDRVAGPAPSPRPAPRAGQAPARPWR